MDSPAAPMRKNTDCRQMTTEEKREHRLAQKRASHARCMADPVRRAAYTAAEKARYAKRRGPRKTADLSSLTPEQKKAHKREQRRNWRRQRASDPAQRAKQRQREVSGWRVAQKREWRRAHATELNARRRAARASNPQKYRAREKAAKRRRRAHRLTFATKNPK